MSEQDREAGVLVQWNVDRGFGFIRPDAGGRDVFCHANLLMDGEPPAVGARVTFVWIEAPKGPRAIAVDVIEADAGG